MTASSAAVLAELLERLDRRIDELERWRAEMAEQVTTKRIVAQRAMFHVPGPSDETSGYVSIYTGPRVGRCTLRGTADDEDSANVEIVASTEIYGLQHQKVIDYPEAYVVAHAHPRGKKVGIRAEAPDDLYEKPIR